MGRHVRLPLRPDMDAGQGGGGGHWAGRAFICPGGGVDRAFKNCGGGGRAQLTDTIIINEKKLRCRFWQGLCTSDFVPLLGTLQTSLGGWFSILPQCKGQGAVEPAHSRGHWAMGVLRNTVALQGGSGQGDCFTTLPRLSWHWAVGLLQNTAALQGAVGSGTLSVFYCTASDGGQLVPCSTLPRHRGQ